MTNKKILIVDDDPINLGLLDNLLDPQYDLIISTNGKDAIEKAVELVPDLIMLDVMMPGMTGFEVCRQLKKNPKTTNIPVIFLSACDLDSSLKEGCEAGAIDYITKPFKAELIIQKVSSYLTDT